MAYKRFVACADNHGSLVCKDSVNKLMGFVKTFKPHYRIHLGDVWDFAPLRRGASQEDKADGIAMDYTMGMEFLDEFKPQFLTLGNHDDRIWMNVEKCADGILRERCQELVKASELEFKKRKIQFIPYKIGAYLRLPEGGPKLMHGFRSSAVSPAKLHYHDWGSCLHGHVHKPDVYTATHAEGGSSFSLGCMGDISQMTYANRYTAKMGWRNGFLYGLINEKTGDWQAWNVVREGDTWISPMGIL